MHPTTHIAGQKHNDRVNYYVSFDSNIRIGLNVNVTVPTNQPMNDLHQENHNS